MEGFKISSDFEEAKPDAVSVENVEEAEAEEYGPVPGTVLEVGGERIETNLPPEVAEVTIESLGNAVSEDPDELPKIINEAFDPERTPGKVFSKDSKSGLTVKAIILSLLTNAGGMSNAHAGGFFKDLADGMKGAAHELVHDNEIHKDMHYGGGHHGKYHQKYGQHQGHNFYNYGQRYSQNIPQAVQEDIRYGERIDEINRKAAYGEVNEKQYHELMEKTARQRFKLMGGKIYSRYASPYPHYRY